MRIEVLKLLPLILIALAVFPAKAQDRPAGKLFATRSEVMARHGMACTSQPLATQAAIDILKQGGTAVDAAIAANAVLGVTEPHVNGIGGDIFAIIYEAKTGKLHGLNGSGRSPYSLTLDELKKRNIKFLPPRGPLPVSVPGCVDGWFTMHKKFGKLKIAPRAPPSARAHTASPQLIRRNMGRSRIIHRPAHPATPNPSTPRLPPKRATSPKS